MMSTAKTHLWSEETIQAHGAIMLTSTLESPGLGRVKLWYRIPDEFSSLISTSFDPFVIAHIFLIMSEGADCIVHGEVSPSLLTNLAEFQAAWACWYPQKYRQVEITADHDKEELRADSNALAVAAFTGGVDSCFTMWRHRTGRCDKRWQRNIEAGLLVHGFDIPLDHEDAFQRAADRARHTLSSVGAKLITMSTNHKDLNPEWDVTHVAGLVSALMLLKRRYCEGLIASGCSYDRLLLPWGSNPATDHLLSSKSFQIVHDGAAVARPKKIQEIANWQEGFHNLRVCFLAEHRDENCGVCLKCLSLLMRTRLMGIPTPKSFSELSDQALENLSGVTPYQLDNLKRLVQMAKDGGIADRWVTVLERRVQYLDQEMNRVEPACEQPQIVRSPIPTIPPSSGDSSSGRSLVLTDDAGCHHSWVRSAGHVLANRLRRSVLARPLRQAKSLVRRLQLWVR